MHFQKRWDSGSQNNMSEISKHALSEILGPLCAEQNVGNLQHLVSSNYGTPVRRTKLQKSKTKCTLENMGLLCAEQHVGNIKQTLSRFFGLRLAEQNVGNI